VRNPLSRLIHHPSRSENAPPVPDQPMKPPVMNFCGLLSVEAQAAPVSHLPTPSAQVTQAGSSTHIVTPFTARPSPQVFPPIESPCTVATPSTHVIPSTAIAGPSSEPIAPLTGPLGPPNWTTPQTLPAELYQMHREQVEQLARRRVADTVLQSKSVVAVARRRHTCHKCGICGCSVSSSSKYCKNPC